MKYSTVLFDLDGTLLPMNNDLFVSTFIKTLVGFIIANGYDKALVPQAMLKAQNDILHNFGEYTNEEVFWKSISESLGDKILADKPKLDTYYDNTFDLVRSACTFTPKAQELVTSLKKAGCRIALATNPFFPQIATLKRAAWAGLDINDFDLITTYENSHYCKPNPLYFQEVLTKLGSKPEETLMIGNDTVEDMAASEVGITTFLLTDCLCNPTNVDICKFNHGSWDALYSFLELAL